MDSNTVNRTSTPADFLATRRSYSPKLFIGPFPTGETLDRILSSGLRVPDHKGLQPWRIIVLREKALAKIAHSIEREAETRALDGPKWLKLASLYKNAGLVVCVVYSPDQLAEIPEWEQMMSAGAVCLSLVNAALCEDYAAAWLSGPPTQSRQIMDGLGLQSHEKIVGLVHIGSSNVTPVDRPRASLSDKVFYLD